MRSPLMKAPFHGTAAKMKAFILPTWKSMEDETAALQAYARRCSSPHSLSKALCHLSRCPASSFPSFPACSQGPACYFVHPCSSTKHPYLILHSSFSTSLHCSLLRWLPLLFLFVVPNDEREKCQKNEKNRRQLLFVDDPLILKKKKELLSSVQASFCLVFVFLPSSLSFSTLSFSL